MIETDIQGYDIDGEVVKDGQRECKACGRRSSDSFSAETGQCTESSEKNMDLL